MTNKQKFKFLIGDFLVDLRILRANIPITKGLGGGKIARGMIKKLIEKWEKHEKMTGGCHGYHDVGEFYKE